MPSQSEIKQPIPSAAEPALSICRTLAEAGHTAYLAGGCVRDLLLSRPPDDFDVATEATPQRVCELFRATREVGAQFGVVLVRKRGRWIEVATFRSDGGYSDGRRPDSVTFGDAREDALRRDFTVNGMFYDPEAKRVIDHVAGRADLAARRLRAIGDPAERFGEDHLRLLRAVRFAARLDFEIEPATADAMRASATMLARVSAERVCIELEKMLAHRTRQRAFQLLRDSGLLPHLWQAAEWSPSHVADTDCLLGRLDDDASFESGLAVMLADRAPHDADDICRRLTLSNEQRNAVVWLIHHQADLDDPQPVSLAALKRLMAHRAWPWLRQWIDARYAGTAAGPQRAALLRKRVAAIAPDSVAPPPLITGDDLRKRHVPPGPIYARVLDEIYTRQLNEHITTRDEALQTLAELLARDGKNIPSPNPR